MIESHPRVVAIISAYNEADIIARAIDHLIREGVGVYLLDHGSTDGTVKAAEAFLGRGLIAIESFPGDRFPSARDAFAWRDILTRKSELAVELDADWFIHHDADEFRESPWEGLTLQDAVGRVDRLGYNAIDFELFNFWPTDDRFRPGHDPRTTFTHFEPGRVWDKRQVKCWKKLAAPPDLVSNGGHDVSFPGRRVFPLRFILRHYPIRSQAHGARKVLVERRPRFIGAELDLGWHVQYDEWDVDANFIRRPDSLVAYDGETARLGLVLNHRGVEERQAVFDAALSTVRKHESTIAALAAQTDNLRDDLDATRTNLENARATITHLKSDNESQGGTIERLVSDVNELQRQTSELHASKSWRWMAPLRAIQRLVTRR